MSTRYFIGLLALLVAAPATAHEGLDFFLARQASGNGTVIGTISDVTPEAIFNPGDRVVSAEFETVLGLTSAEEPGFFNPGSLPGTSQGPDGAAPLLGDEVLLTRVDVEVGGLSGDDLFYWDGQGAVNFVPTAAEITFTLPTSTAAGDGFFDDHPDFTLTGGEIEGGVYLLSVTAQLGTLANGITDPSVPLFIVFGNEGTVLNELSDPELDFALDAAADFVSTALIPEPASAALLLIGAVGFARRRR